MQKLLIHIYLLQLVSTLAFADIVFLSDRDGKSDIYVMNDHGGNIRRVTDISYGPTMLSWSSDGQQIAVDR